MLGILLHRCYTSNRIDAQGVTILRRAYALFFACIDTPGVRYVKDARLTHRSSFVPLLVHLTEHRHVTAHRIRVLYVCNKTDIRLRTYQQDKDPWLYSMLDAFATYEPALLLPVDQVQRKPHHVKVQVPLALWAQALPYLLLPDMVPGLVGEPKRLRSHVPHRIQLALLVGVGGKEPSLEEEVGARLATSLGRLLAANAMYAQRHDPHIHWDTNTIPPFDAAAFGWLEQLYPYCASLQTVPLPLLPFIAHVIHSMGQDAVRCMTSTLPVAQWEHTWRPTMRALVRLYAWMPPLVWTDFFPRFLQPLCYLAALDDVSDLFSSQVFYAIARMIPHWAAYHAPELQELVLCAWELQASLMLGGDPTLPVYMGILDVHRAMAQAQIPDVTGKTFPFPFFSLAAPPAMAGSVATLDRLCEHVCMLRASVTKEHHVLDARLVDDMATALVDMLWSGRAFAQCLQRGVVIDGMVACDRSAVAVWKQTCDAFRIVPFVLVASLSHGPWLAPLFEQYCHEALLPGYNIRAPITPSALRGARGVCTWI